MSERLFIIRSDEAYDLATAFARRPGRTTIEIVGEALRRYEESLDRPDQSAVEVSVSPVLCEGVAPVRRGF